MDISSLTLSARLVLVVTFDGGGYLDKYEADAALIKQQNIAVQITGRCYSACTYLADLVREHVCITPNTRFYIHQATEHPSGRRVPVEYRPDFSAFIGPQPTEGWRVLTYDDLSKFWRTCP